MFGTINIPLGEIVESPIAKTREGSYAVSPDGRQLAEVVMNTQASQYQLILSSLESGKEERVFEDVGGESTRIEFSPFGDRLVVSTFQRTHVLDLSTGNQKELPQLDKGPAQWITFSSDGQSLLWGHDDGDISAIDADTGIRSRILPAIVPGRSPSSLIGVRQSPQGDILMTLFDEALANWWDITESGLKWRSTRIFWEPFSHLRTMAISQDAQRAFIATGGNLRIIATNSDNETAVLKTGKEAWKILDVNADTSTMAVAYQDGTLELRSTATGELLREIDIGLKPRGFTRLDGSFSADGRWLVNRRYSDESQMQIQLWSLESGQLAWRLMKEHAPSVGVFDMPVVAVSADGKWIVAVGFDRSARRRNKYLYIWSVEARALRRRVPIPKETGEVTKMAFSPTDNTLVMGTYRGDVLAWTLPPQLSLFK